MSVAAKESTPPLFSACGVTKFFGSTIALGGIDLSLHAGEQIAIMGPSGSGKSTLLHTFAGISRPSGGTVLFRGENLYQRSDAARSRLRLGKFGFVYQELELLAELTNLENVALPLLLLGSDRKQAFGRAGEMLAMLGLGEIAGRYPAQVSGGQAKLVALARALVTDPEVLFCDEPTGALDQPAGHELMQQLTLNCRAKNVTLLLVTHDRSVASWCERLIEIRDGRVHGERIESSQ